MDMWGDFAVVRRRSRVSGGKRNLAMIYDVAYLKWHLRRVRGQTGVGRVGGS